MHYPINVCHFSTVHLRTDTRIRVKQVASLADMLGTEVSLFVQDGLGNEIDAGANVRVVDLGKPPRRRLARMTLGAFRMWRALRAAHPRVVHFHDPELISVGLALKFDGIRVIYDVHEDLPRQIMGKYWIPHRLRRWVSWMAELVEIFAARTFDGIVAATPTISKRFSIHKTVTVQNFPILSELVSPNSISYSDRPPHFVYLGGISEARGALEMVRSLGQIRQDHVRLELAGVFQPKVLKANLAKRKEWGRVHFHGWASRFQVARILGRVRAGLVVLHPTANYLDAFPVKLFEYMAAGLPVIASDFPLWRQIVEGAGCGILVDPLDIRSIAEAMQWLLDNPAEAEAMGRRGRLAVEQQYNWAPEAKKLVKIYRRLLNGSSLHYSRASDE